MTMAPCRHVPRSVWQRSHVQDKRAAQTAADNAFDDFEEEEMLYDLGGACPAMACVSRTVLALITSRWMDGWHGLKGCRRREARRLS